MTDAETTIPYRGRFTYTRAELIADAVVHAVGLVLAIAAGATLLTLAVFRTGPGEYVAATFYVASLLAVLSVSLAYNVWPLTPAKWILRRIDHAAIYLLIAATYTPFLTQLDDTGEAARMIALVWGAAAVGIALKLMFPGRFDRLAIFFYLAIGWSGVVILRPLVDTLTPTTLWLLLAGGLVYCSGIIFFVWQALRFQSALWHGFVVVGAGLHFAAITDCLVITRL
jgi:hemolysin III